MPAWLRLGRMMFTCTLRADALGWISLWRALFPLC